MVFPALGAGALWRLWPLSVLFSPAAGEPVLPGPQSADRS